LPPAAAAGLTSGMVNTGKPVTSVGAPAGTVITDVPGARATPGEELAGSLMTTMPGAVATTMGLVTAAPGASTLTGDEIDAAGAETFTVLGVTAGVAAGVAVGVTTAVATDVAAGVTAGMAAGVTAGTATVVLLLTIGTGEETVFGTLLAGALAATGSMLVAAAAAGTGANARVKGLAAGDGLSILTVLVLGAPTAGAGTETVTWPVLEFAARGGDVLILDAADGLGKEGTVTVCMPGIEGTAC